jgi:alkylation response protein AidB-like acyl-CoA dehydrogenase
MHPPPQPLCRSHQLDADKFELTNLLNQIAKIADFCAENAAKIDCSGAFPVQEFELIARAGLLTAPLAPKWGGLGLGIDASSISELLTILTKIGRANLAVGRIYEGHVNALQLIQTFGTPTQIEAAATAARDHKIFGVWNAEATDGVKIMPLGNGRYRLEGAKTFATGCGYVDRPFIGGALPNGAWQLCIVPMDEVKTISDPSWWQPAGMRATASCKVDFTGVVLAESALIGQPGDYYRQPWLTAGVVRFAAVQLGGAEALFDAARQFLQSIDRTQDPYQEERLGKMAITSGRLRQRHRKWSALAQGCSYPTRTVSPDFCRRSDDRPSSSSGSSCLHQYGTHRDRADLYGSDPTHRPICRYTRIIASSRDRTDRAGFDALPTSTCL